MKNPHKIPTLLSIVICMILTGYNLSAQTDVTSNRTKSDSSYKSAKESSHILMAGIGAGNNMTYMGSGLSENKPYLTGSLIYGYKGKLFLSAAGSHLSAFDPMLSFSTFAVSYNQTFGNSFDILANISRYQVNSSLTDSLFSSFNFGSLALGFDWKILYTNISLGGILSKPSALYLNLKNSRYFEIKLGAGKKNSIYIEPYANLLFGNLTKTVTTDGTYIGIEAPFKSKKSSSHGSSTVISTTTAFSLIEADFGLPLGVNIGRFTLEADPGYILPAYKSSDTYTPEGLTMMFNLYIKILN